MVNGIPGLGASLDAAEQAEVAAESLDAIAARLGDTLKRLAKVAQDDGAAPQDRDAARQWLTQLSRTLGGPKMKPWLERLDGERAVRTEVLHDVVRIRKFNFLDRLADRALATNGAVRLTPQEEAEFNEHNIDVSPNLPGSWNWSEGSYKHAVVVDSDGYRIAIYIQGDRAVCCAADAR